MNEEKFWARIVERPNGCKEWTGATNPKGYGRLSWQGKYKSAHRIAWTLLRGEIPSGMLVLHSCDNPPCCNIEHLWLGTGTDNMRDMTAKGRGVNPYRGATHCKRGHLFDQDNTQVTKFGRTCRTCKRAYDKARWREGKYKPRKI